MRDSSVLGGTRSVSAAPSGRTRGRGSRRGPLRSAGARRRRRRATIGLGAEAGKLEVAEAKGAPSSEDHRALHDVLQLPDVPGPWIGAELGHGRFVDPPYRLADRARVPARPVLGEERDVLGRSRSAGTRIGNTWRRKNRSERNLPSSRRLPRGSGWWPRPRVRPSAASRCRRRARTRAPGGRGAGRPGRGRQLADLVEEDRAPGRQLEPASPPSPARP
jgi:hypothetical protein